jgi:hypothetical protein
LRDFASLSSEEIQNWGRKRTLRLAFCEFTHVIVTIRVKESSGAAKPNLTDVEFQPVSPLLWRMLFQSIMHRLDEQKWTGVPATISSEVGANLLINGKPPASITMSTKVRRVTEMVSLASVFEYADPSTEARHAELATFDLGTSEIIESSDDKVAMTVDLSTIKIPENCCFETFTVDAGRVVNMQPKIIGFEQALNTRIPIQIRYEFLRG